MEASLAVCILAALLAMGSCLQCEVCTGVGNSCTGSMQTCASGQDSCGIFLTEIILAGVNTQSIHKTCVTSSQCKAGSGSMNFGQGMTTRTSVACCVGDACRTTTVTVPPAATEPNGRSCRGCYVLNAGQCNEQTIACTGAETQCIDATGTVTIGGSQMQTVMKGCASESVCAQREGGPGTFTGISADLTTANCTAASGEMGVILTTRSSTPTGEAPSPTTPRAVGMAPPTTTSSATGAAPGATGLLLPALAGLLLLNFLS